MKDLTTYFKKRSLVQQLVELQIAEHDTDQKDVARKVLANIRTTLPAEYAPHIRLLEDELKEKVETKASYFNDEEFGVVMHGLNISLFKNGGADKMAIRLYYDGFIKKNIDRLHPHHHELVRRMCSTLLDEYDTTYLGLQFTEGQFRIASGSSIPFLSVPKQIHTYGTNPLHVLLTGEPGEAVMAVEYFQKTMEME